MSTPTPLPFLRPVPDAPAVFLRPGHNDHKLICQILSEGRAGISGAVLDPAFVEEQEELRNALNRRNLWSVLDPKALELSTQGGLTARRKILPWAGSKPHTPSDLENENGRIFANQIVDFLQEHGYSALLAPSHYLTKGFSDPWLMVDFRLYRAIKDELNRRGAKDVAIYYPLSLPTRSFFDPAQRIALKTALQEIPKPDAVWLRIHPFGSQSGHVTLESYIRSCRDLQDLGIPLVGEKVGAVGSALLAFGALGGIELGVSSGEAFDFNRLMRKGTGKGFAPHRGVLIGSLGISLDAKSARSFFENRTLRANYSCQDVHCCRHGHADTLKDPRRHFVLTRMSEVSVLNRTPYQERPSLFLERHLRPATDRLGRVAQADIAKPVKQKIEREQRKLSGWRNTLGELSRVPLMRAAIAPAKRIARLQGAA